MHPIELLPTGISGLDQLLQGGLVAGNSYVVKGHPGSGKTTLGIQYLYTGAVNHGQNGLILTFEERPEKLFRDALSLGFDLHSLEAEGRLSVVCSSPEVVRKMLLDPSSVLSHTFDNREIRRVMVDSLTAFRKVYRDEWELREAIAQLINSLMSRQITPLLIREIHPSEGQGSVDLSFEDYLADAVLQLGYAPSGPRRRTRTLEVIKTRSHPHIGGRHSMIIGPKGLEVFPSCQPAEDTIETIPERGPKLQTGVPGLDSMLDGGLVAGSSTMLAGSSGTGKTTLCLQFLARGLVRGEQVLLLTLQEPPKLLLQEAASVGVKLKSYYDSGQLGVLYASPIGLDVDELMFHVRAACAHIKPTRVVLDSLSDIVGAISDETYLRDYIYTLTTLFAAGGSTTLMTYEVPELFGQFTLSHERLSGLIDNVIFLRYVEMEAALKRAISVLKVRGSSHDKRIHELLVTAEGVQASTVFEGQEGLMSGAPKRIMVASPDLGMDDILEQLGQRQEARKRFESMKKGQPPETGPPGSRLRPRP